MTSYNVKSPRKLIEVALPLDAINEACVKEKNPFLKGHPRAVHLWWARRPIAAARAVLFAQLVNDPGYQQDRGFKYGRNKKEAAAERKRLFKIIEDLVLWENTENETVLERARAEIRRSWREVCDLNKDHPQARELFNPEMLPEFHDPFAGGGTIPLEAQRLGLKVSASDLNPVAVLINKAMIEIPPKFAGRPPACAVTAQKSKRAKSELGLNRDWSGAMGLAEDIRHYGAWMREEAVKRIGSFYPPVEVTAESAMGRSDLQPLIGQKLTIVAWLWARTVKSPNPAFSDVHVPLCATFILTNKPGKEAYVVPVVKGDTYSFTVKQGIPTAEAKEGTKVPGRGSNFRCIVSNTAISGDYIKAEGQAGRMGVRLLAIVAEGGRGKIYVAPTSESQVIANKAKLSWQPVGDVPARLTGGTCVPYGFKHWGNLFTSRQLMTLTLFSDLAIEAQEKVHRDAVLSGYSDDAIGLHAGGSGAKAYAEAISVFLACGISQLLRYSCSSCSWNRTNENVVQAFGRQAFPMVWDFAEANLLDGSLSIEIATGWVAAAIEFVPASSESTVIQADAQTQNLSQNKIVSTDPPYYDNIAYADLSDFFYVWLRRSLKSIFPTLFATISVPKNEELVATAHRHGGRENAEKFFLSGMTQAMHRLAEQTHPEGPITIYYAFKQSDTEVDSGTTSTGWETFLAAVLQAGFQVVGTWPMRTEKVDALKKAINALASSIVLVCRKRPKGAPSISRREFIRELNGVLPEALDEMTRGAGGERSPVAPVDLSQAIIGAGMAVFSKYAAVLEADGSPMTVRTALQLINRFLAEDDFDHDSQFCLHWFEQHGWKEGVFGEADTLARAKGTSVDGVRDAGVIQSGGGKVRLLKWTEYPSDWDPREDKRLPIWEGLHHLIRAFRHGGDTASGALLAALGGKAEAVRQLACRLYTLCERLGHAEDARAYNELITSWTGIESAAAAAPKPTDQQLPGF